MERIRNGKKAVAHATRACEITQWKHSSTIDTLGVALAEDGQFDKAIALLTKFRSESPVFEHDKIDRRLAIFRAGKTYRQAEAEKASTPAIPRDPKTDAARSEVVAIYRKAVQLEQSHRLAEARVEYEKAVDRAKQSLGADQLDTGMVLVRLGDVHRNLHQPEQAVACYTEALTILRRYLPRDDQNVTYAVNNLAYAFADMDRHEDSAQAGPGEPTSAAGFPWEETSAYASLPPQFGNVLCECQTTEGGNPIAGDMAGNGPAQSRMRRFQPS